MPVPLSTPNILDLPACTIRYADIGDPSSPTLVFLHGIHMNATLWGPLCDQLSGAFRCIVPTLPLGGHDLPAEDGADLSMRGQADIVAALLDRLDLTNVTLVGNDSGGVVAQILAGDADPRIDRIVLISCEAFDNFPPGLPGRMDAAAARIPGGLWLSMNSLRLRPMRRSPVAFGWMAKHDVPDDIFRSWLQPFLRDQRIRKDTRRVVRAVNKEITEAAAQRLSRFGGEALIVWAAEDKVMPPKHAERLSGKFARAAVTYIDDSYTLVPLDQPRGLADRVREFMAD